VRLEVSPELRAVVDRLPAEAFRIDPERLSCRTRRRSDVPETHGGMLASGKLSYDAVEKEAERRRARLGSHDALKAISSFLEVAPGDPALGGDLGGRALTWGLPGQAYHLARPNARLAPQEPGRHLALARCAETFGRADLALLHYETALSGRWGRRFEEIRRIAGLEYLSLLGRIVEGELTSSATDFARSRAETLRAELGLGRADLVVTISWNTDRTDVDLHVTDPTGEECFYGNRDTNIGGHLTRDVRAGYGPEMFVLRKAVPGTYRIVLVCFASDQLRTSARTRALVTIVERWGRKSARVTRRTVTLAGVGQRISVAEILWP
jgi:hypothetical protein